MHTVSQPGVGSLTLRREGLTPPVIRGFESGALIVLNLLAARQKVRLPGNVGPDGRYVIEFVPEDPNDGTLSPLVARRPAGPEAPG